MTDSPERRVVLHSRGLEKVCRMGEVDVFALRGVNFDLREGVAGVLLCPETKAGGMLRTPARQKVLAAARVLRRRQTFSIEKYGLAIKAACADANALLFRQA